MCCIVTVLLLIGPRAAILVWWLIDSVRWTSVFGSFIWPLLGFLFLPWTTLAYVLVAPGGVAGFDWVWLAIGLIVDIGMYSGGVYGNRDRLRGKGRHDI